MFRHIFAYRLKVLLRDKTMIFWTMIFPIALATFFNLAFGGLGESGSFNVIDVALVETQPNPQFMSVLDMMTAGETPLFALQKVTAPRGETLLADGHVAGIITVSESMSLKVNQSGIRQSILKVFLDRYAHTTRTAGRIAAEDPQVLMEMDFTPVVFTEERPVSHAEMDIKLSYFYALIAMACFYGSFFGMEEVNLIQANLSKRAARLNMAPLHKLKAFLYSSLASYSILIVEMMLLMAYLVLILKIDFGNQIGWVIFTIFVGSLTGISFGGFIASMVKGDENVKTGLLIGATMAGSFLAGMMFQNVKHLVQLKAPILQYLNPVNLLADAFYALYFFNTCKRYLINIAGLLVFAVVFAGSTYLVVRRRKYASV
ncbi:MAG: hypothetical protein AVO33_05970 [delta proteobacterium ML8_F1]|nr:MAG: hypothetical protein AVO33_05970 [delta proteobacterium ML8_F1]